MSVSFGSFIRSTRALGFVLLRVSPERTKSAPFFLQRDCANTSQLCGLKLAPKTDPIGMQSV